MSEGGKPHVDRKQYLQIFAALFVLTALEVGIVYIPGIGKVALGSALILMALGKAWLVMWFFMHLGHETKVMRSTVVIPFAFPAIYAAALIADAAWRLLVT